MQSSQANPVDKSSPKSPEHRIEALLAQYGDGNRGLAPTRVQWERLFEIPDGTPITLINFFKLRTTADYSAVSIPSVGDGAVKRPSTGAEAMMQYASVSGPALEKIGGRFLLTAPFANSVMGADERWDMVAIGRYPSLQALLELFEDKDYAAAFRYRMAAVDSQRVSAVQG